MGQFENKQQVDECAINRKSGEKDSHQEYLIIMPDKEQGSPLLMAVIEMGKLMNSPLGEDS